MKTRRRDLKANPLPGQKPEVSAWRLEKAHRLQRQFKRMAAREAAGKTIAKRLRFFSWYWSRRFYQCDPSRRVEFSPASLARLYRRWKQEGCVLSALLPRYRPAGPAVPLRTMQRFAAFLSRRQWRTVKEAWKEFERRRIARRAGRGTPLPISLGQVYHSLRGGWFRALQKHLRAVEQAQAALAEFEMQLDATLRARLPIKPQRKRRTSSEVSRDSSAL